MNMPSENRKHEMIKEAFLPNTSANAPVGISNMNRVVKNTAFTKLTSNRFSPLESKKVTYTAAIKEIPNTDNALSNKYKRIVFFTILSSFLSWCGRFDIKLKPRLL